jgi:pyruvate dehydrogenase E2 component (dihydrolipoamide acetyltransferase)
MHIKMEPLKNPSSWRKMSVAAWREPDDPTIYGRVEIEMNNILKYVREKSEKTGIKITPTHCIARGIALALNKYPKANAIVRFGKVYLRKDINVFLQVAIEGAEPDLSGVCIRNADQKKVEEIAKELSDRAKKVRDGSDPELAKTKKSLNLIPSILFRFILKILTFLQYTLNINLKFLGMPEDPFGSIMVTNVGTLGIDEAYAPIVTMSKVPLLLTVGAIKDRPVVLNNEIVIRPVCVITGSFDHRVIDGVQGAIITNFVKDYLSDPWRYDSI